jgi:hypothetical protein
MDSEAMSALMYATEQLEALSASNDESSEYNDGVNDSIRILKDIIKDNY